MERLHSERRGRVALLRMDDGKANAIQGEFLEQLSAALDAFEADDGVRAVALAGRPGYFSAGLDLKTLPLLPRDEFRRVVLEYGRLMLRLHGFPKPVVGVVTGHALAGGCVLLLGCDHRIGAAGPFKIGLHEATIGLPLPTFVLEMARPALSPTHLHEATLAGRIYDPEGARAAGYLHEVQPPETALDAGLAAADALGALVPSAFALTKRRLKGEAIRRGLETAEADIDAFLAGGPFAR